MPALLFLVQRIPYPPNKGEKIRAWEILKHLSRSFDVHLGSLIDDPADRNHADTVRSVCKDAYLAMLGPIQARARELRSLATGQALSVHRFHDFGLARWTRRVIERVRPEVVFVNSSNMAAYVLDLPRTARRIVDLVDVDSAKWRAYARDAGGPMRRLFEREARAVFALECRIAQESDACTFVSEAEAALFRALLPDHASKIHAVPNGVDSAYFDPAIVHPAPYDTARPTFVFTGTMDYAPNIEAVSWFTTGIMPRIREELPNAQFYIVGANPAPAVRKLRQLGPVHVTGRVPDVRPYVQHAVAAVAPMRIARGIQNKVLEAMALRKPVVVTSGALEGIEADPGRDLLLADNEESFAEAAVRLASGTEGQAIGAAARRCVLRHHSWSANLRQFDPLLGLTSE
jgi:polysaccharide biosynthesis protein PslH